MRPLKVRDIDATFKGIEQTQADYTIRTSYIDSNGVTRETTETRTAVQRVEIVKQAHLLSGREANSVSSTTCPTASRRSLCWTSPSNAAR